MKKIALTIVCGLLITVIVSAAVIMRHKSSNWIVGTWSEQGVGTRVFNEDGTGYSHEELSPNEEPSPNEPFKWSLAGDQIFLSETPDGKMNPWEYKLSDDQKILSLHPIDGNGIDVYQKQ